MTYALRWHAVAEKDLQNLPHWRTAARVDDAMMRFADEGGPVEHTGEPGLYRLRVAGAVVLFSVDAKAREINVWRVLSSAAPPKLRKKGRGRASAALPPRLRKPTKGGGGRAGGRGSQGGGGG